MDILNKNWWLKQLYKENIIELSELQVANPNITAEKVADYFNDNVYNNNTEFADNTKGWKEYRQLCRPYVEKYNMNIFLYSIDNFKQLSKPDLIKFYNEMRVLVRKHIGTEILNELQVANPNITAEKAQRYWYKNIYNNNTEFGDNTKGWKEYRQLCRPYLEKYNMNIFLHSIDNFKQLSKPDLIQFYKEMRALVHKYAGKEILNELQVANPSITPEKVQKYYKKNIRYNNKEFDSDSPGWKEYKQLCQPYCEKYNINGFIASYEFTLLSKPELIKLYNEMRALVRKYVGKEILNELQVANPNISAEKVERYCANNILNDDKNFVDNSPGWQEYKKICKPYIEKYDIDGWLGYTDFKELSKPDLAKIYNQMRVLVRKYVGTEILNELQITDNTQDDKEIFKQFIKFCCNKLNIKEGSCKIKLTKNKSLTSTFAHLDPNIPEIVVYIKDRNILDSMRSLAHELKHYQQLINNELTPDSGKDGSKHENEANAFAGEVLREFGRMNTSLYTHLVENINELQVANPNITPEKVQDYYFANIIYSNTKFDNNSPGWQEYEQICKPYCEKYGINVFLHSIDEFSKLSKPDLIKLYNEIHQLVKKHTK